MRLDQWLWAVRVYKTRSLAAHVIRSGDVLVGEAPAKASHEVRMGEVIRAQTGTRVRVLRVLGIPPSRVGAKLVSEYAEELPAPEPRSERPLKPLFPSLAGLFTPEPRDRGAHG
jgi:ribosome-associated heat shock protein Hsp15